MHLKFKNPNNKKDKHAYWIWTIPAVAEPQSVSGFPFLRAGYSQNPLRWQEEADPSCVLRAHYQVLHHCVHMVDRSCACALTLHKPVKEKPT
jgi:hypothetical protein